MNKKTQSGFTLIELLLGVTISVMIFLAAGSVLALLFRTDVKSKNLEGLEQTKNNLSSELTTAIRWGEQVGFNSQDLVVDSTTYSLSGGRILKNGEPLTPNDINITRFNVTNYSNSPDIKSLEISIDLENRNFTTIKDTFNIVVSQRRTQFNR